MDEVRRETVGDQAAGRSTFAEDLGRIFEVCFNTGLLTAIGQHTELETHFGDMYKHDLQHLRFPALVESMYTRTGVFGERDKDSLRRWLLYTVQKGFLAGLNFFEEYLQSFAKDRPRLKRHIVYLQCNFHGRNSLKTYIKNEEVAVQDLMDQLARQGLPVLTTIEEVREHGRKGNFLNADTLMLLRYGKRHWRILCLDLSIFSIASLDETRNLSNVDNIKRVLEAELRYLRSKSVFTNLSIDTDTSTTSPENILSEQLKNYFTAFKREDKETSKLIQAASYAHDFYTFLLRKQILQKDDEVLFNVIGYTDRAINAMSVNQQQVELLATCAEIYKQNIAATTIDEARLKVLADVQRAASRSFQQGRAFVSNLLHLVDKGDGMSWLEHSESIDSFVNTRAPLSAHHLNARAQKLLQPEEYEGCSILDAHAALITKALQSSDPYVFLTGNPGIGKTTAIVDFLKAAEREGEGFLLLYVSPRKQVNLDIIQKFREDTGLPPSERLFGLTTNSVLIRNNSSRKTVHYYSRQRTDTFVEQNISFIHADSEDAKSQNAKNHYLEEIQEGLLIDKGNSVSGVLDSLCSALHVTLENNLGHSIVATVAIQSLKRLGPEKGNTLHHFDKIFKGVLGPQGQVILQKMQQLGDKIKHFFVMVDEVTGDESGVEFLHGLHSFLEQYGLFESPHINTKVIVADASIVDPQIIRQHLGETTYEPDKIYFRRLTSAQKNQLMPLSVEGTEFQRRNAVVINANAYPASKLHIDYRIGVDALLYDETTFVDRSKQLQRRTQDRICADIIQVLNDTDIPQLLVYIQDKQRLAQLIQMIKKERGSFELYTDYLEIHANLSESERGAIADHRTDVKVVFMTASASRGLSFPSATHIIIEIPHFEIEQNLMEILQVIYRGRGGSYDQEEKHLTFFLTDRVIYTRDAAREVSVRESMLNILNVLLILKLSMMTRIAGSLKLGLDQYFMMIPIGGKSVYAAGETFTSRMSRLIKEAQTLRYRYPAMTSLRHVEESISLLLEHARISLRPANISASSDSKKEHYIPRIATFTPDFQSRIRQGFDRLLDYPTLEPGHIAGSMLIIPITGMSMQESYWMRAEHLLKKDQKRESDLLKTMRELLYNPISPPSFQLALRDGIALLQALKDLADGKIPRYEQESNHTDQHYAFPLITLLAYDAMREFFAERKDQGEDIEGASFRTLLERYVRTLYSIDSVLPIGKSYEEFPFIVFRSLTLNEARNKMFTGKYLFMSQELNIINMLLASSKEE